MTPDLPRDPELRTASTEMGPVAYTDAGAGEAIVCVHGLPGSSFDFRWLDAAVGDRARVIRVDLPGFGATPAAVSPEPTVEARTRVVVALLDALALDRVVLVGHSFGGPTAVRIAADQPHRVARLGLLAATGLRPHRAFRRFGGVARLLAAGFRRPIVARATIAAQRGIYRVAGFPRVFSDEELSYTTRAVIDIDWHAHRDAIARISCPTLVAWADDDPLIEPAIQRELAAAVPNGPRIHAAAGGHNVQKTLALEVADALL